MKLTLAGAGVTPGDLSLKTLEAIKKSDKIILRTDETRLGEWLKTLGFEYESLDRIYLKSRSFATLTKNLAAEVLKAAKTQDVLYLVEGDVKDDISCSEILKKRPDAEIIPGVSKADYYLDKAAVCVVGRYLSVMHDGIFKQRKGMGTAPPARGVCGISAVRRPRIRLVFVETVETPDILRESDCLERAHVFAA